MKISMAFLLCAPLCIFGVQTNLTNVYDIEQIQSDLDNVVINDVNDVEVLQNSSYVDLKSEDCLQNSFTRKKKDVSQIRLLFPTKNLIKDVSQISQIRLLFPTKNLIEAWDNPDFQVGFRVYCYFYTDIDHPNHYNVNTNWFKFYQNDGTKLDPSMDFTQFTMNVGKCQTGTAAHITNIEILFHNPHVNAAEISLGRKPLLNQDLGCERIDNFKTMFISHIPSNPQDIHYKL